MTHIQFPTKSQMSCKLSLNHHKLYEIKNHWISGTFKARYHGIYQFSVSVQFEGHSTYEFELVRGGRSGATQVLALGKSKNSEFGFKCIFFLVHRGSQLESSFLEIQSQKTILRTITHTKCQSRLMPYVGQMTQLTDKIQPIPKKGLEQKFKFDPSVSVNRT